MKKILNKLKKGSLTEIYTYKEEFSNIGTFLEVSNKYIALEVYNYNGKRDGIKLIHIDTVTRVCFESNFLKTMNKKIKMRKKEREEIRFSKKDFFKKLFETIIEKEIFLQIKFGDENQMGYLRKIDNNCFYFDLVEKNLKLCSKDVVIKDYNGLKLEITKDVIESITVKNEKTNEKKLLIEYYWNEIEGNIIFQDEEYTLLCEKENFYQDSKFSILKTNEIREEIKTLKNLKIKDMDISEILNKVSNLKMNEILKMCKENKNIISIGYRYVSEVKTGIIEKIEKDKIILKEFDMKIADFSYNYEIKKECIEMLHIKEFGVC